MAVSRISQNAPSDYPDSGRMNRFHFMQTRNIVPIPKQDKGFSILDYDIKKLTADNLLLNKTIVTCQRYKLEFSKLSTIQRKFITHYRCSQCGLLPLYKISLVHVKRVRCGNCGQLVGFTRKGKYGKLRKEIAIEFAREIQKNG